MSRNRILSFVRSAGFVGCAVSAVVAVACGRSEPTEPQVAVSRLEVIPLAPPPLDAGSRVGVDAMIRGANDVAIPVSGVAVRWDVPPADGSIDSAVTRTNALGTAHNWYTAPTVPGIYHINAVASEVLGSAQVIVGPADVARLEGALDSIRFTRLAASSRRAVRGVDRFGNAVADLSTEGLTVSTTGPFTAGLNYRFTSLRAVDTLAVQPTGETGGVGEIVVRGRATDGGAPPVILRVRAVFSPVVASVRLVGGLDSLVGVAVGESRQFVVEVRDSSGTLFSRPDFAALGVQFSSSDPTVAEITAQGVVRGIRAGTAQITAQRGDARMTTSVPVVPALDLGNLRTLYPVPLSTLRVAVSEPAIDDLGNSVVVATSGGTSTHVEWRNVDGSLGWTRTFGEAVVALSSDRGLYVQTTGQLVWLDADGRERWRQNVARQTSAGFDAVVASPQAVYVSHGPTIQAFGLDGTPLWTHPFPGEAPRTLVTTPTRIFVNAAVINGASRILALDLEGRELWSIPDPGFDGGRVADDASTLFFSVRGELWALDANGTVRWRRTVGTSGSGWFALGPNGTLVFTSSNRVEAVSRTTGATVWTASSPFAFATVTTGPDKVFVSNDFILGYDGATGRLIGKTIAGQLAPRRCTSAGLVVRGRESLQRFDRC